jgi:hypothetical protein
VPSASDFLRRLNARGGTHLLRAAQTDWPLSPFLLATFSGFNVKLNKIDFQYKRHYYLKIHYFYQDTSARSPERWIFSDLNSAIAQQFARLHVLHVQD